MLAKAQTDRICYIDLFAGPGRYSPATIKQHMSVRHVSRRPMILPAYIFIE
jgi:hypothetical protein